MNRLLLLTLTIIIGSCSSVPLSTIARMSSFDSQDFVSLNPDDLRVIVVLPREFTLDTKTSWLGVDISSSAGMHQGVFELCEESVRSEETSKGFFSEPEEITSYLLSLTPASKEKFNSLQVFVSKAAAEEVTIRVVPKLASRPENATSVSVSIDLQLSQEQGFFTLVDSAQLMLGESGQSDDG